MLWAFFECRGKSRERHESVLHAMDYTVYAELQLGRDGDASAVVNEASAMSNPEFASL